MMRNMVGDVGIDLNDICGEGKMGSVAESLKGEIVLLLRFGRIFNPLNCRSKHPLYRYQKLSEGKKNEDFHIAYGRTKLLPPSRAKWHGELMGYRSRGRSMNGAHSGGQTIFLSRDTVACLHRHTASTNPGYIIL